MSDTNTTAAPGTELVPLSELAVNVPELLTKAKAALVSAQEARKKLPKIVDEATKQQAFKLKDGVKQAHDTYKELRMPFTRKLDDIKKEFTGTEAALLEINESIDKEANAYAEAELKKKRQIEAENEAKLKAQQAKIDLEGRIRDHLRQRIGTMLESVRKGCGTLVDNLTAENLTETKNRLSVTPSWIPEKMDPFYFEQPVWITDKDHFINIANEEMAANRENYLAQAKVIMTDTIAILEVALNNKAEATRLQEEARKEAEQKQQELAQQDQARIDAEKALASLDQERPEAVKAKGKMKIQVLSKSGWTQIVVFWFEHEKETQLADYPKRTLQQMLTFAERKCNNDGLLITHPDVKYVEEIKATR